jgi:hypothetical protein
MIRIRRAFFTAIPIILLALLSSCYTELKVKVDILDRNALHKSKAFKTSSLQRLYYLASSSRLYDDWREATKSTAKAIMEDAVKNNAVTAPQKIIETVSNSVGVNMVNMLQKEIDSTISRVKTRQDVDVHQQLNYLFVNFPKNAFNEFAKQLLLLSGNQQPADFRTLIDKHYYSTTDQWTSMLTQYGNSIIEDPIASLIAQAPDQYWKKFKSEFNMITDNPDSAKKGRMPARMNKTTVKTFIGNTDIAIKMDAPGFFVVKGVRLDADAAIKASFKVLNQGIKYMAYASGIPVNSPAGGTENSGKSVALPEKNLQDSLQLVVEKYSMLSGKEKSVFLTILFSQLPNLDATKKTITNDDVKQSVDIIQRAFEVYINKNRSDQP